MPENAENFDAQAELTKLKGDISTLSSAIINAKSQVETIEFYYKKFEAARVQLDEKISGIEKAHQTSEGQKVAIDTLKQEAEQNLAQIKTALQGVQANLESMRVAYQDFEQTKQKIDDPDTGLLAIFTQANDLKEKVSAAKISVDEILSNISLTKKEVDKLRQDAETEWKEIVQIKEDSESLKSSISETLDLVTDSSHSNAFIRRKQDIQWETYFWGGGMILSLIGLAGAVLFIYYVQAGSVDGFKDWHQWYRYLFTSPLVYLVYVCSHNYNLARTYLEKYAFKGVMATTLTSYTKLFKDQFPKAEEEVLQFALETIGSIYKAPYQDRDSKRKLYFSFYNVVKGGLSLDDSIQVEKETTTKQVTKESVVKEKAANETSS